MLMSFLTIQLLKNLLTMKKRCNCGRCRKIFWKVNESHRKNNRIVEISKGIFQRDALGVSIDVYKFSRESSKAFFNKCSEYIIDKKELNGWTEDAINEIDFSFCQLSGRWVEIDNMVKYARGLFSNKWYI